MFIVFVYNMWDTRGGSGDIHSLHSSLDEAKKSAQESLSDTTESGLLYSAPIAEIYDTDREEIVSVLKIKPVYEIETVRQEIEIPKHVKDEFHWETDPEEFFD